MRRMSWSLTPSLAREIIRENTTSKKQNSTAKVVRNAIHVLGTTIQFEVGVRMRGVIGPNLRCP